MFRVKVSVKKPDPKPDEEKVLDGLEKIGMPTVDEIVRQVRDDIAEAAGRHIDTLMVLGYDPEDVDHVAKRADGPDGRNIVKNYLETTWGAEAV